MRRGSIDGHSILMVSFVVPDVLVLTPTQLTGLVRGTTEYSVVAMRPMPRTLRFPPPTSSVASWIPPTLFRLDIESEHEPFVVPKVFNTSHGQHHCGLIVGKVIGFFSFEESTNGSALRATHAHMCRHAASASPHICSLIDDCCLVR